MVFDPSKIHRQSYRLEGYDYSSEGAYSVTICTRGHECTLGDVLNGEMKLSEIGEIVHKCWIDLPSAFSNVTLDEYQIMPSHVHGILVICGNRGSRDLINQIPTRPLPTENQIPTDAIPLGIQESHFGAQTNFPLMKNPKQTLGKIIRHFKAKATKKIHDAGYTGFGWQGRFYDHIVRDEQDLERLREFIRSNPLIWSLDEQNPVKHP